MKKSSKIQIVRNPKKVNDSLDKEPVYSTHFYRQRYLKYDKNA